jgi:hypothetical protein
VLQGRKYRQKQGAAASVLHCLIKVIDQVNQTLVIMVDLIDACSVTIVPDKQHIIVPFQ